MKTNPLSESLERATEYLASWQQALLSPGVTGEQDPTFQELTDVLEVLRRGIADLSQQNEAYAARLRELSTGDDEGSPTRRDSRGPVERGWSEDGARRSAGGSRWSLSPGHSKTSAALFRS